MLALILLGPRLGSNARLGSYVLLRLSCGRSADCRRVRVEQTAALDFFILESGGRCVAIGRAHRVVLVSAASSISVFIMVTAGAPGGLRVDCVFIFGFGCFFFVELRGCLFVVGEGYVGASFEEGFPELGLPLLACGQ